MSSRPRRHPLDQERPAIPSGPRGTLPPRPNVPYNNNDTWREPRDRQYQSPGTYRDDRGYQAGPSYTPPGPGVVRGDPYVPRAPYESGNGNYNARAGPSWQPTESYRPTRQPPSAAHSRSATSTRSPPTAPGGTYVPLHLRAPLVDARSPIPYPPPASLPTHFGSNRQSPAPVAFEIPLPDDEYMELSAPFIAHEEEDPMALASKLLVLDLNGTLIYRNKGGSNSRVSYPRPYLGCFFKYLYRPLADENTPRPWEVFVWSSAQPHNVRTMLESNFDPEHIKGLWGDELNEDEIDLEDGGKVLGVWARDKMGLSDQEYSHKTQTTKDLRKVESHFESDTGFKRFPLETILLLDDSPLKAVYQPWNQLVLPEYDREAYQASHRAVDENRPNNGAECDEILLAVIGVLEATSSCENIPAWIRAGGLKKPDIHLGADTSSDDPAWFGVPDGPAAGVKPTLKDLPTFETFTHWFQDEKLLKRWIEKGKEALKLYGIPLEHGLGQPSPSARSSPAPPSHKANGRHGSNPPGHTVPPRRQRGYSPSRPSTLDLQDDMSNLSMSVSPQPESLRGGESSRNGGNAHTGTRLNGTTGGPNGQTRSYSTEPRGGEIVDTWRTFRSIDVSIWLADLSERSSLNEQDRQTLGRASELVHDLDTEWLRADQARYEEMNQVGAGGRGRRVEDPFVAADITDEFFNSTSANGPGFSEADRLDRQKHVATRTKSNGNLPKNGTNPKHVAQPVEDSIASRTRHADAGPSGQSQTIHEIIDVDESEYGSDQPVDEDEDDFVGEEPEPINAQYPLDHPTSTFDLPPFLLRGNPLSRVEIARYFARAAGNKDPIQQQLLRDLVDWEVKHRQATAKIGTAKPPHPQMIGSSLRHMDKLRQKIIGNEDIRDMKNARIAERRREIKSYRDRGLVPPPPRKAPKYNQQLPKGMAGSKSKQPKEKKRHKPGKDAQSQLDRQRHKEKMKKRREDKATRMNQVASGSNTRGESSAAGPSLLNTPGPKVARANQVAPGSNTRGESSTAGPSLLNTPGPSTRTDNKSAVKSELQPRSQSSKRRASDTGCSASVKVQRVD